MGKELKSILPQLIDGLKHDSLRGISVNLLSTILAEATQAVPHLIDLLKTRNGNLGCYVPAALASAGSKAIPPLAKLMEHEEIFVRARAIKTIGLIGGPASSMVPRLIQKLNTGSILERVAAAGALGNIGPTGASVAVPALKAAVRDRDIALRCAAIEALGKLKGQAESAISDLCDFLNESLARQIKWRALTALKNIGVAGVPRLLQALKNADEEVRRFAAGQLSEFGKVIPSVVPALIECLGDADAGVRASAVESLEKIGSRAVVARSSLEQLLRDPCEIVRERTKVALNAMST
jgi:HEAT repeat protein